MLYTFNNDDIISKFIKALLMNTYVPIVHVWKPGDAAMQGFTYITKDYIIKANMKISAGEVNSIDAYDKDGNKYFTKIRPYIEGEEYKGITSNYQSNAHIYDAETHKYLGEYLRMLRDLHNLDLMSLYNCVTGEISQSIRIVEKNTIDGSYKSISTDIVKNPDGKKVYLVPIKFNQPYTIYVNTNCQIDLASILYDGHIKVTSFNSEIKTYVGCSNINPIVYQVNQVDSLNRTEMFYRKYLTLVLQVPETCNNVVVLEGDYSASRPMICNGFNEMPQVYFGDSIDSVPNKYINTYCKVNPALTRVTTNKLYAFSDKLIEYLLLNAVTNTDEITDNVKRVQQYANSLTCFNTSNVRYTAPYTKGIWSNSLQAFLYDLLVRNKKYSKQTVDVLGYLDKDAEFILTRGQDV